MAKIESGHYCLIMYIGIIGQNYKNPLYYSPDSLVVSIYSLTVYLRGCEDWIWLKTFLKEKSYCCLDEINCVQLSYHGLTFNSLDHLKKSLPSHNLNMINISIWKNKSC